MTSALHHDGSGLEPEGGSHRNWDKAKIFHLCLGISTDFYFLHVFPYPTIRGQWHLNGSWSTQTNSLHWVSTLILVSLSLSLSLSLCHPSQPHRGVRPHTMYNVYCTSNMCSTQGRLFTIQTSQIIYNLRAVYCKVYWQFCILNKVCFIVQYVLFGTTL